MSKDYFENHNENDGNDIQSNYGASDYPKNNGYGTKKAREFKVEILDDGYNDLYEDNYDYISPESEPDLRAKQLASNISDAGQNFQNSKSSTLDNGGKSRKKEASSQKAVPIAIKGKKGRSGVLKGFAVIAIALIASIVVSTYALSCINDLLGLMKNSTFKTVTLDSGETLESVARKLKEADLITQPQFFIQFAKIRKYEDSFLKGTFELNSKMGYEGILDELQKEKDDKKEVRLTFPEGITVSEIADKLADNEVCTREAFLAALKDFPLDTVSTREIKNTGDRYYKLEGYLFPDTYGFYVGENPKSVIRKFVTAFNKRFNAQMRQKIAATNRSFDEIVIIASMVQAEAGNSNEMGTVASVFYNRLGKPNVYPRMQSDATMTYFNRAISPFAAPSDAKKFQALFDTYNSRDGLPPSPICCPGIDALNAALEAPKTPYYFFVMDKAGGHYYGKTLKEHERNIATAEAVNRQYDREQAKNQTNP